jgi:hypothetical protein
MTDDENKQRPGETHDFAGLNYLAAWRFAYDAAYPGLTIFEVAFGRTVDEAEAALKDPSSETPAIRLVVAAPRRPSSREILRERRHALSTLRSARRTNGDRTKKRQGRAVYS